MKNKTVYLYNPQTMEFTSSYVAQESPMEPGHFITPIHCTDAKPPELKENQTLFFDGVDGWIIKETPVPTKEEELSLKLSQYRIAVRQHMTAVAKAQPEKFNSISEAKSFTGVENELQVVSNAMTVWAAKVQNVSNKILDEVAAGQKPLPKIDELIKQLPVFVHP